MKIGILGTGIVSQTIGGKLVERNQDVMIGTRDVAKTIAQVPGPDSPNSFSVWLKRNPGVKIGTFAEAAGYAEIVINATSGLGSLEALRQGHLSVRGR